MNVDQNISSVFLVDSIVLLINVYASKQDVQRVYIVRPAKYTKI